MKTNQNPQSVLLENRLDALEAFEIFSHARNFLFWIILVMLIMSQGLFWMVDRNLTGNLTHNPTPTNQSIDIAIPASQPDQPIHWLQVDYSPYYQNTQDSSNLIDKESLVEIPTIPPLEDSPVISDEPNQHLVSRAAAMESGLKLINYLGAISCLIYCFCLIAGMKLVIIGNLGGLANATKAFFLSLALLVLILPWQNIISPQLPGTLYNWNELASMKSNTYDGMNLLDWILYYGRFSGLWLISIILLIMSQIRSMNSVKAVRLRVRQTLSSLTETGIIHPITPKSPPVTQPESSIPDDKPIPLE